MKIKLWIDMTLEVATATEANRAVNNIEAKAREAAAEIGANITEIAWCRTRTRKVKDDAVNPDPAN